MEKTMLCEYDNCIQETVEQISETIGGDYGIQECFHHAELGFYAVEHNGDRIALINLDFQKRCVYGNKQPCFWLTGIKVADSHERKGIFTAMVCKLFNTFPSVTGISMVPTSHAMVAWLHKHGCSNAKLDICTSISRDMFFGN